MNYLNINNNILIENPNNLNKLALNIKKQLKITFDNDISSKFDRLYQRILLTNKMSDTEDMEKYYQLYKELDNIKELL